MNGNPWKGLNSYTEGDVIFGRDLEIRKLSQYIFNNTQTVLYGRSGIGKSSILNAGIYPEARKQGIIPISIRLKHDDENDYLEQIKDAFKATGLVTRTKLPPADGICDRSIWEFMHRNEFVDGNGEVKVPLLVFDQFEEIFSLQKNESLKRDFFKQLGNLLNDVKPEYIVEHESQQRQSQSANQETKIVSSGTFKGISLKISARRDENETASCNKYIGYPIYHIVFSLREDSLSSLERYSSRIPVMKDNRFGLLPINEEQAADIIRLPRKGLVDDDVTKLIIEQVTGRKDFMLDGIPEIEVNAAVLSLYLSKLYAKKSEEVDTITAQLVNNYSGHIIHDFYEESISSDPERGEEIRPETILLLEDKLLTIDGHRNNVSRSDLIAQGVSVKELDILTNGRKLLHQFHHGDDLRIEYIHDILCPVVKERKEQREIQRKQEEERRRQEVEKQKLQEDAERHIELIKKNNSVTIWLFIYYAAMIFIAPEIITSLLNAIWGTQISSDIDNGIISEEIPNSIAYITKYWHCSVNAMFPIWKQIVLIYSQIFSIILVLISLLYIIPRCICKFINNSLIFRHFIKPGLIFFPSLLMSSGDFMGKFVDNQSFPWIIVPWGLLISIILLFPKTKRHVA